MPPADRFAGRYAVKIDPRRLVAQLAVAVIAADGRIVVDEIACLDNLWLGRLSKRASARCAVA
jgi:hypothetical protein